jgi:hypothetical protein
MDVVPFKNFFATPLMLLNFIGINFSVNPAPTGSRQLLKHLVLISVISTFIYAFVVNLEVAFDGMTKSSSYTPFANVISHLLSAFRLLIIVVNRRQVLEIIGLLGEFYPSTSDGHDKYKVASYYHGYSRILNIFRTFVMVNTVSSAGFAVVAFAFPTTDTQGSFGTLKIVRFLLIFYSSWSAFILVALYMIYDLLFIAMSVVLSMEFDSLSRDFCDGMAAASFNMADLKILVDRHNKLIDLVNRMQAVFAPSFLYSYVNNVVFSALFCADAILGDFIARMTILVSIVFISIFTYMPYYYGQKLSDASAKVGKAIEASNWYNFEDESVKRSVHLLVIRGHVAKYLSGFGFFKMNRETFKNVSFFYVDKLIQDYL